MSSAPLRGTVLLRKAGMTAPELVVLDVGHGNAAVYLDGTATVVVDGGADYTLSQYARCRICVSRS
jgi:hypothetical protein